MTGEGPLAFELARWETEGGVIDRDESRTGQAPRDSGPSFRFVEHMGEIELRLRAWTLPELFAAAGQAMAALMLGESTSVEPETKHDTVTLEAADLGALLVAWLDELIYLAETEKVVFTRFEVRHVSDKNLRAELHGVSPATFRSPVKAATYHRLRIDREGDGALGAIVVLDV